MKHRFAKVVGIVATGIAGSAIFLAGPAAAAATPTTVLASRDTGAAGAVSNRGTEPSTSADGRYVTFEATDNFGTLNPGGFQQIWRRDLTTNTTVLVSRADGASGAVGDSRAGGASMSADGRYVAFDSASTNLVTAETIPTTDCSDNTGVILSNVYVRDLVAGTTRLVSHAMGSATTAANNNSDDPRISPDGLTVAYTSQATDLTSDAMTCGTRQLYAQQSTLLNVLVARGDGVSGTLPDAESDGNAALNTAGTKIAFVTSATNLVSPAPPHIGQIYVRDLTAGTTTLISRADGASGAVADGTVTASNDLCGHPGMSADGNTVVFSCDATNLGVAAGTEEVYMRNLTTAVTTIVSRADGAAGAPASADSSAPVISADGTAVVFESNAPEVSGDVAANVQVVERFLDTGTTALLSRASGDTGAVGNSDSSDIATSADGSVTAFESTATNLTLDTLPVGEGQPPNVFVRTVTPPEPLAVATASPPLLPPAGVGPARQSVGGGADWPAAAALLLCATVIGAASARRRLEH